MIKLIDWVEKNKKQYKWFNEKILEWDDFKIDNGKPYKCFVISEKIEESSTIDTQRIVGQWNHYAGQTWLEALLEPQYKEGKMKSTIALADNNPNYYFSLDKKNDICFSSIDGKNWYSNQGNHRTVLGKFVCEREFLINKTKQIIGGVNKYLYFVDWETIKLYENLLDFIKKNNINLSIIIDRVKMSDGCYEPIFHLHLNFKSYDIKNEFIYIIKTIFIDRSMKSLHLNRWDFKIFANWFINGYTDKSFIISFKRFIVHFVNIFYETYDHNLIWFPGVYQISKQNFSYDKLIDCKHQKNCPLKDNIL